MKKTLSAILAVLLAALLCACGNTAPASKSESSVSFLRCLLQRFPDATKFPAHRSWYLKLRVYSPNPSRMMNPAKRKKRKQNSTLVKPPNWTKFKPRSLMLQKALALNTISQMKEMYLFFVNSKSAIILTQKSLYLLCSASKPIVMIILALAAFLRCSKKAIKTS